MLKDAFSLLVVIPFILGFVTYGIAKFLKQSKATTSKTIEVKVTPDVMKQLQEYIDPATGKLKSTATTDLKFEVDQSGRSA